MEFNRPFGRLRLEIGRDVAKLECHVPPLENHAARLSRAGLRLRLSAGIFQGWAKGKQPKTLSARIYHYLHRLQGNRNQIQN
jgi:hypothetical protein